MRSAILFSFTLLLASVSLGKKHQGLETRLQIFDAATISANIEDYDLSGIQQVTHESEAAFKSLFLGRFLTLSGQNVTVKQLFEAFAYNLDQSRDQLRLKPIIHHDGTAKRVDLDFAVVMAQPILLELFTNIDDHLAADLAALYPDFITQKIKGETITLASKEDLAARLSDLDLERPVFDEFEALVLSHAGETLHGPEILRFFKANYKAYEKSAESKMIFPAYFFKIGPLVIRAIFKEHPELANWAVQAHPFMFFEG